MLQLDHISRTYRGAGHVVTALDDVSLEVKPGELVALCGPSGSGKTTLLMIAAGLLHPTAGTACVGGVDLHAMSAGARAKFRAKNVGIVFQLFCLVPYLTVIENVLLAGAAIGRSHEHARAATALERLGLEHRIRHLPSALSVGEQQRTAVARAMFNRPKLILADEPTGNLDTSNAAIVLDALRQYAAEGNAILMITHGDQAASAAHRVIHLANGVISHT